MRKTIATLSLVLVFFSSKAQTTYYGYNQAGVPVKIGYSTPTQSPIYSKYVPTINPDDYSATLQTQIDVARFKQEQYNKNVASLTQLINATWGVVNNVNKKHAELGVLLIKMMNFIISDMNSHTYDYGNYQIYRNFWDKIYNDVYKPNLEFQ